MPKIHIERSVEINAPSDKIYTSLSDFNTWTIWSPWLIMDPEATVTVADDAKSYSWDGKRVGSGNMEVTSENGSSLIDYNLNFLKPWKSKAKVRFKLQSNGDSTQVTWSMDSSLPFFLFWMKKMMEGFVGMDYERGLDMLKDYMEDGVVHSKIDFKGISRFEGCQYFGIRSTLNMDAMSNQMKEDFEALWTVAQQNEGLVNGHPFTIYHKWDIANHMVSYTSCIPVSELPPNFPDNMVSGKIPATDIYSIAHTGPYHHLGNAWSTLYNMQRAKEFKVNKGVDPFETYLNSPGEVADNELVTVVNFPIK